MRTIGTVSAAAHVASTEASVALTRAPTATTSLPGLGQLQQRQLPNALQQCHQRTNKVPYLAEGTNNAFMFLKPHANTPAAREFVLRTLKNAGIGVVTQGSISTEQIAKEGLIDTHYGSLAMKALHQSPVDTIVQPKAQEAFQATFGLSWQDALARGLACNAREAMQRLGCTAEELDEKWTPLKLGEGKVKFGGGFYCGLIDGLYVINGFYMAMRSMYTRPNGAVHYFVLDWRSATLSWEGFRSEVVGATDPSRAVPGSLRSEFLRRWRDLGLPVEPHAGENAVHASASPLEAMAERLNWMRLEVWNDPFGRILQSKNVSPARARDWASDPMVQHDGRQQSLFDVVENLDTKECIQRMMALSAGF